MADKDLISFLVEETLKIRKGNRGELSSLELKLTDYGLSYLKGEFIPQLQVLRFKSPFGVLDVPVNWSIFAVEHSQEYILLNEQQNVDQFFTVISRAWKQPIEQLLVTHDDGFCYIVGLKVGEDAHLHDLLTQQEWLKSA